MLLKCFKMEFTATLFWLFWFYLLGIGFPMGKGMYRVVHIPEDEAVLLNSREKAPYLICVEVLKSETPRYLCHYLFKWLVKSFTFRFWLLLLLKCEKTSWKAHFWNYLNSCASLPPNKKKMINISATQKTHPVLKSFLEEESP